MAIEKSEKDFGMMMLHIGLKSGDSLLHALEMALNSIRYAFYKYGEDHYKDYLAEKGLKFKTEEGFIRVATKKKSDIERIPVTKAQVNDLEKLAKKYGCDFYLCKRPENLEQLLERKFVEQQALTQSDEKLLNAFLLIGPDGRLIRDPNNPQLPLLNDRDYMFTIRSTDWNNWDLILRKMEAKYQKPTLNDRIQRAKIKFNLDRMKTGIDQDQQKKNWQDWKKDGIEPKTQIDTRQRSFERERGQRESR